MFGNRQVDDILIVHNKKIPKQADKSSSTIRYKIKFARL